MEKWDHRNLSNFFICVPKISLVKMKFGYMTISYYSILNITLNLKGISRS